MRSNGPLLLVAALAFSACGDDDPSTDPDAAAPDAAAPDAAAPDSTTHPDLSAALEAIRAGHGIPALTAALASPDAVLEIGAAGTRHRDTDVAVTTEDVWHIGSCTKAMTATLVAFAVEEGRLAWDTTLAEALPALAEQMHADYRDVPIEWLLVHRAGTWSTFEGHEADLAPLSDDDPVDVQRAMFAEIVLSQAPELAPGTAFAYSNAGYMIAGAILEVAYGMPWEELLTDRLFDPLGMASCGFGPPGTTAEALDQPWGHGGDDLTPVPPDSVYADNPPAVGPAGTVHCALADWAKFGALQLGAHDELLDAATLGRLHTPPFPDDDYALGWALGTDPLVGNLLVHDGSNTMWLAVIMLLPDEDRILLVAANAATAATSVAVNDALIELAGRRDADADR
jgi:CubicO group peptidase (beta-lactamase class C family)